MKRYLPQIVCLLCFLLGLSFGWYLGYTRPSVVNQRKILRKYEQVKEAFHATDAEMADYGGRLPEFWEAAKRQDEFAAGMALNAFGRLERGNIDGTRQMLARTVSIYYRGHKHDGDSNFLARIERYAATNAAISNAIYGPLDDGTNHLSVLERRVTTNAAMNGTGKSE